MNIKTRRHQLTNGFDLRNGNAIFEFNDKIGRSNKSSSAPHLAHFQYFYVVLCFLQIFFDRRTFLLIFNCLFETRFLIFLKGH